MSESVPSNEQDAPQGRRRVPRWLLILAGGVAVVLTGVAGGAIVAATHRGPDLTSVGCVTSSVAERTLPAVVTIHVQAGAATGSGSGEVIRSDGYILTSNEASAHGAERHRGARQLAETGGMTATVVGPLLTR